MTQHRAGDYRESHVSSGYGARYKKTYEHGYYHQQWTVLERPLLEEILLERRAAGATSLLDFACGTGRILELAEGVFDSTMGVDVSESMIDIARRTCDRSEIRLQDITENPLEGEFDVVTAFRFFLNAQPELRQDALRSLRQAMASGGYLIANIHVNATSPLGSIYRLRNKYKGNVTANTLSRPDFEVLLERSGFVIESVHSYSFLPRPGWKFGRLVKLGMEPVERACRTLRVPDQFAQSFMVVARRAE